MTTIWSAFMIVPTRWATMMTVAPTSSRDSAARSRASVAKSSAEKLSSKTKMPALAHDGPGDGQPLALAARDVGAALGDRRLQPAVHGRHEVARLGDLEGAPQLLVRGRLVAVAQVAGDACR